MHVRYIKKLFGYLLLANKADNCRNKNDMDFYISKSCMPQKNVISLFTQVMGVYRRIGQENTV